MRIDVLFTPAEFESARLEGAAAVVIDVLRASTTIVEALAAGASAVVPVVGVEEARALAGPGTLVGGERGGLRCEGFDLGNSPGEYTAESVGGRRVVLCTSNGTRAIAAAAGAGASPVLVAGFVNLKAAVRAAGAAGRDVVAICAGCEGAFSLEDAACAGGVVAGLAYRQGPLATRSDAAVAAETLFRANREQLVRLLGHTAHGRRLVALGLGDDLAVCAELNRRAVVPRLAADPGGGRVLVPLSAPGEPER
jgi:2-phosphosulfolactate phosphatase